MTVTLSLHMLLACVAIGLVLAVVVIGLVIRHQRRLVDRAFLMGEAVRNGDYQFRLPVKGLLQGERALQERLNTMVHDLGYLRARHEVEAWQRLIRVLTHEIMNATAPIESICQAYLGLPDIDETPYGEGIRAIQATAASLSRFVAGYRSLATLPQPHPTEVLLQPLVERVASLYPTLRWRVQLPSGQSLFTDEALLRRVLENLVKNAAEAHASTIDVRWLGGLCVSNDGDPIPPDVAREIFVPFFTTKPMGSGIGLPFSRQILVMQGYDLQLAHVPVGRYHVSFLIRRL